MKKRLEVALAVIAGFGLASIALAQAPQHQPPVQAQATPNGWNYELDARGNRVPKANRVTNPDGSWREEIRQGKCLTVREKTASGEFKQSSSCGN